MLDVPLLAFEGAFEGATKNQQIATKSQQIATNRNKEPTNRNKSQQIATNRNQASTKNGAGTYQRYDRQKAHDEDQRILSLSVECKVEGPSAPCIQCKIVGCRI
jgi:hypothetical protein